MELIVLPSGELQLRLEGDDDRETVETRLREVGEVDLLTEMTESYWTNGGFQPFDAGDANPFVGLTSAPCIAESLSCDDDGRRTIEGRLWWFPDYQTVSLFDVLLKHGAVEFSAAPVLEEAPDNGNEAPAEPRRAKPKF